MYIAVQSVNYNIGGSTSKNKDQTKLNNNILISGDPWLNSNLSKKIPISLIYELLMFNLGNVWSRKVSCLRDVPAPGITLKSAWSPTKKNSTVESALWPAAPSARRPSTDSDKHKETRSLSLPKHSKYIISQNYFFFKNLSDPLVIEWHVQVTTVPLKALSDQK